MTAKTYAEYTDEQYRTRVSTVARRLRETAQEIEDRGLQVGEPVNDAGAYAYAAQRVLHAFIWGVANSGVDGIISAASSADRALTKPLGGYTQHDVTSLAGRLLVAGHGVEEARAIVAIGPQDVRWETAVKQAEFLLGQIEDHEANQ